MPFHYKAPWQSASGLPSPGRASNSPCPDPLWPSVAAPPPRVFRRAAGPAQATGAVPRRPPQSCAGQSALGQGPHQTPGACAVPPALTSAAGPRGLRACPEGVRCGGGWARDKTV